jgi:hypothetical protein
MAKQSLANKQYGTYTQIAFDKSFVPVNVPKHAKYQDIRCLKSGLLRSASAPGGIHSQYDLGTSSFRPHELLEMRRKGSISVEQKELLRFDLLVKA